MSNAITNIGNSVLKEQVRANLKSFFDWEMLNIGGFYNVSGSINDFYSANYQQLEVIDDENYEPGRVWGGRRSDWVWETGINYTIQPFLVSGVTVDSTFYPTGNALEYAVDYPNGRIVFNDAISVNSVVECNHSYRWGSFFIDEPDWYKDLLFNSYYGSTPDSGRMAEAFMHMPCVLIETLGTAGFKPYELGGGKVAYQNVRFTVLADNSQDRDKLEDIILSEEFNSYKMYDLNSVAQSGDFALDESGSPIEGFQTYPQLLDNHVGKRMTFQGMNSQPLTQGVGVVTPELYGSIVKCVLEIHTVV